MRSFLVAGSFAGLLALTSCAGTTPAVVNADVTKDIATAEADFAKAVQAYNVAKGIADVAVATDPSIAATIAKVEGEVDPIVAKAEAAEAAASADAPTIMAELNQVQADVTTLITTSAADVKVVGNTVSARR